MHGYGYGMGMWSGMGWMWLWPLVLVIVVIAVAFWAVGRSRRETSGPDAPEEVLRQRLARGEIEIEEYRARVAELRH